MSEQILLNVTPMETRAALLDNGVAQEIHIERASGRGLSGNIYLGKVVRVLPGMQAAFVDFGGQRTGFIHCSDIQHAEDSASPGRGRAKVDIRDAVREGEKLIVQVTREPQGGKGARLTTRLSLSSRYLVMMPGSHHRGISRVIDSAPERERLQLLLSQSLAAEEMTGADGFILRTAAEGITEKEVRDEVRFLKRLWGAVSRRAREAKKPRLLYDDLPLQLRTLRDLARPSLECIVVDDQDSFLELQAFCRDYIPELSDLLQYDDDEQPLFERHGVEDAIQLALQRQVELPSGGHLVIDQTEAMTTVDINTGAFVGNSDLEETLLQTNLEAATVLARQIRLRNLGGIIIVDFIDMQSQQHREQLHGALDKAMQADSARYQMTGVSDLGLVQMTRKRSGESLTQTLCQECPTCEGSGRLKTAQSVCYDILRQIMVDAPGMHQDRGALTVLAAPAVVARLQLQEADSVANLEQSIGKAISFRAEPGYSQEHYDIVLL